LTSVRLSDLGETLGEDPLLAASVTAEQLPTAPAKPNLQTLPRQVPQLADVVAVDASREPATRRTTRRRLAAFDFKRRDPLVNLHAAADQRLGFR
jgi:hypothetical protein